MASATPAGRPTASRPRPTRIHAPKLAVVHNGIIENFRECARSWEKGRDFRTKPTPGDRHWSRRDEEGKSPVEAVSGIRGCAPRLRSLLFAAKMIF